MRLIYYAVSLFLIRILKSFPINQNPSKSLVELVVETKAVQGTTGIRHDPELFSCSS